MLCSCSGSLGFYIFPEQFIAQENGGRDELYIYLPRFASLFLPITAHSPRSSASVLAVYVWVSSFHNCPLIPLPYMLHAIHRALGKIWDSEWSEFSSFSPIPSQQQIKTYAAPLSWHSFFHLCWGNALECVQPRHSIDSHRWDAGYSCQNWVCWQMADSVEKLSVELLIRNPETSTKIK